MENFRKSKSTFFKIIENLKPILSNQNTKYQNTILVETKACCFIYELAHGVNFLIYNELFARRSPLFYVTLHEFVHIVKNIFRKLITWLKIVEMKYIMEDLKVWCGLPSVQGAINGTHIFISKPSYFP